MKLESLSNNQIGAMPKYVQKWNAIGLSTLKCNIEQCESIVSHIYKIAGLNSPKYILGPFNNPIESAYAETLVDKYCDNKMSSDEANKIILNNVNDYFSNPNFDVSGLLLENQIYGSMDASWLSFYDYFLTECDLDECKYLIPLMELSKVCGWWTPLENAALFQHRPQEIHFNNRNRIHNDNGAAIKFNGIPHCNVYAIHGVIVNKDIMEKNFTIKDIEKQTNIEVRRVMIDIYGRSKYIIDSGAVEVSRDDFGILYVKEQNGDEPIYMVKVVNATVEPDGTSKDYWIRVDPKAYGGLKTAKAAVAATWQRMSDKTLIFPSPDEYDPDIET